MDADYRGNVGVVLFNFSQTDYEGALPRASADSSVDTVEPGTQLFQFSLLLVKRGDRVAQLVLERIMTPDVVEVEDLDSTDRGAGGYGSTGKN